MNFKLFLENFNNPSDLFLDPENKNKTWDELEKEFFSDGGKFLGIGKYGKVYDHPKWPYVVKVFKDQLYTAFARFAYKNPHPAFPKFYGLPQKILPFYKRYKYDTEIYIIRIERLLPLDPKIAKYFMDHSQSLTHTAKYIEDPKIKKDHYYYMLKDPKVKNLFDAFSIIQRSSLKGSFDLNPDNIMQRKNGDFVLIDPLWFGSNPYADAQAVFDAETDRYGYDDEEPPPPDVIGGRFPVKKRKKKKKSYLRHNSHDDEAPF